ncbi:MAG: glycosyltransferase [Dehalococcoidia bacterium]
MQSAAGGLRVMFVIPGSADGASMIFARREVEALQRMGVNSRTFYLSSRTEPKTLAREWRRLRREISTFNPHLVHAQYGTMTALLTVLATNRPVVTTYRGSDLNPAASRSRLISALGKALSRMAALKTTRIICVSPQLKTRLWWGKGRASVIPSGVDTAIFKPRPKDAARAELGWSPGERIVLFNGRNPRVKRLDLARSAVEHASAMCGKVRLEVLDGTADPALVPTFMNAADCLLLTSDWEGSPTVVQEAMACNLPVVSVDVGDVRERLDGVHPSYIVTRNPQDLGEALAAVMAERVASNGRAAAKSVSTDRTAEQIMSVYKLALKTRQNH